MSIYLVHCPSLGVCKVGYATDVNRRFWLIRACTPAPVELVATREGERDLEAAIHRELKDDRHHGEWFKLTERTLLVFETTTPNDRKTFDAIARPLPNEGGLYWLLRQAGLRPIHVAAKLGVGRAAVSKWCRTGIPPERVIAVEKATGIPRHELRPDIYPPASAEAAE